MYFVKILTVNVDCFPRYDKNSAQLLFTILIPTIVKQYKKIVYKHIKFLLHISG